LAPVIHVWEDIDAIVLAQVIYVNFFNSACYFLTYCIFSLQRTSRVKKIAESFFKGGQLDHKLYWIYTMCWMVLRLAHLRHMPPPRRAELPTTIT